MADLNALDVSFIDSRQVNVILILPIQRPQHLGLHDGTSSTNGASDGKFPIDEIQKVAKEVIGNLIGGNAYIQSEVNKWCAQILEETMSQIAKQVKGYKIIGEFPIVMIIVWMIN